MVVLASMTVYDKKRRKVVERVQYVFEDEDSNDFDKFCEENKRDIVEFLQNALTGVYSRMGYRFLVDFEELEEEHEELTEDELKIELSGVIKWLA